MANLIFSRAASLLLRLLTGSFKFETWKYTVQQVRTFVKGFMFTSGRWHSSAVILGLLLKNYYLHFNYY